MTIMNLLELEPFNGCVGCVGNEGFLVILEKIVCAGWRSCFSTATVTWELYWVIFDSQAKIYERIQRSFFYLLSNDEEIVW